MIVMIEEAVKESKDVSSNSGLGAKIMKRKHGIFPHLPLKKAIELAKAIHDIGQGEPVIRIKVFDQLGKSPDSGPSRTLVVASGSYGLTQGGYQADHLKLTEVGKILVTTNPQLKKYETIYNILFGNEIFSSFIEYWKNKVMPVDDIASDWFVRNHNLETSEAQACWAIIKTNITDFKLTEQLSGKSMILSKDSALESIKKGEGGAQDESQVSNDEITPETTRNPAVGNIMTYSGKYKKEVSEIGEGWSVNMTITFSKRPLPKEIRTAIDTIITSLETDHVSSSEDQQDGASKNNETSND